LAPFSNIIVRDNAEWPCLYIAIFIGSRLILDVLVLGQQDIEPAVTFLHRPTHKHDPDDGDFYRYLLIYDFLLPVEIEQPV